MKSSVFHSAIFAIFLFIMTILSNKVILAQDINHGEYQDTGRITLPFHGLSAFCSDTVRLTLISCGKGLSYYDYIFQKPKDNRHLFTDRGDENASMVKGTLTESDLEVLKYNLRIIEKQSRIQAIEWMRKEKWDMNLGETIKGYYMKPIF